MQYWTYCDAAEQLLKFPPNSKKKKVVSCSHQADLVISFSSRDALKFCLTIIETSSRMRWLQLSSMLLKQHANFYPLACKMYCNNGITRWEKLPSLCFAHSKEPIPARVWPYRWILLCKSPVVEINVSIFTCSDGESLQTTTDLFACFALTFGQLVCE